MIAVSDNGWTTNQHGLAWIQQFEKATNSRIIGAYRLLTIDGHASHLSLEFESFCTQHKIIRLCMPPHSSHLLQPLDIGCFGSLKRVRAYGDDITRLALNSITRISKINFLQAFKTAYNKALTLANICAGFKSAGLVPFNPDTVLAKLEVHLHTPTPPSTPVAESVWQSQTLHNTSEFESQYQLVRSQLHNTSPSRVESLDKLAKGCDI